MGTQVTLEPDVDTCELHDDPKFDKCELCDPGRPLSATRTVRRHTKK